MEKLTYKESKELEELKHKNHMKELEFIRETEKIRHQNDLERLRIKTAEIKKAEERKWLNAHGRR